MHKLLIALSLLTLTGCKTIDSRGQFIDDQQIASIENKNLTKEEVANTLGLPSLTPDYTANTWYYTSRSLERKIFTEPKVVSQRVVKVTFTGNKVDMVEVLDNSHKDGLMVEKEYTRSLGTDENVLQKFTKNFGRFNGTKKKKHR